eukprot:6374_1
MCRILCDSVDQNQLKTTGDLRVELASAKIASNEAETKLKEANEKCQRTATELGALKESISALQASIEVKSSEYIELQTEHSALKESFDSTSGVCIELQTAHSALAESFNSKSAECIQLQSERR